MNFLALPNTFSFISRSIPTVMNYYIGVFKNDAGTNDEIIKTGTVVTGRRNPLGGGGGSGLYLGFGTSPALLSQPLRSSLEPAADEPSPVHRTSSSSLRPLTVVTRFGMDLDMCFARSAISRCRFDDDELPSAVCHRLPMSLPPPSSSSATVATRSSDVGFDELLSEARPIGGCRNSLSRNRSVTRFNSACGAIITSFE